MLGRFRGQLTYANVISTVCLVLILGGGVAYAADTVFSSDIVNGEVKSADIGNNQVRSADVRDDTLANGGLGGADIANNSLRGPDIAEPTLQNVDASTVGGLQVRRINFQVPIGTGPRTVLNLAGLRITAECQGSFGAIIDVKASTSKPGASAFYVGFDSAVDDSDPNKDLGSTYFSDGQFNTGSTLDIDNATDNGGDGVTGVLQYSHPDGSVVVARLTLDEINGGCALTGIATGG